MASKAFLAYVNQWQAAKKTSEAFQSYVAAWMKTGRLPETIQKTRAKRVPVLTVRRAESFHADQSFGKGLENSAHPFNRKYSNFAEDTRRGRSHLEKEGSMEARAQQKEALSSAYRKQRSSTELEKVQSAVSYAPASSQGKEIEHKRLLPKQEVASANQSRGKNAPLSHEHKLEDEKKQAQNRMDEAQKKYNKINKKVLNQLYSGNADSRMIEQAKDTSHKQIQKVKEAQKELNEAKEGVKDAKKKAEIAASKKATASMNDWQKIEYYSHLMSKRKLNAEEIKEAKEVAKKWIQANPYHVQKNGQELYQKGVDAHGKAIYGTKEEAQSVRVSARGEGRPDQSIYTQTAYSVANQNPITSAVQGFGRGFGITGMGRLFGDASNALNEKIANVTHNQDLQDEVKATRRLQDFGKEYEKKNKMQNPYAYGGGKIAGNMAAYATVSQVAKEAGLTEKAAKALEKAGITKEIHAIGQAAQRLEPANKAVQALYRGMASPAVGETIANMGINQATDLLVSDFPAYLENRENGMKREEAAKQLLKDQGASFAQNLVSDIVLNQVVPSFMETARNARQNALVTKALQETDPSKLYGYRPDIDTAKGLKDTILNTEAPKMELRGDIPLLQKAKEAKILQGSTDKIIDGADQQNYDLFKGTQETDTQQPILKGADDYAHATHFDANQEINGRGSTEDPFRIAGGRSSISGGTTQTGIHGYSDRSILRRSSVNETQGVLRQKMTEAGITDFGLTTDTDAGFLSDALGRMRGDSRNDHAPFVSMKTKDELADVIQNGGKILGDQTGRIGIAVTNKGDIEAVFHNKALSEDLGLPSKGAMPDLMLSGIANGGDRLDCYSPRLAKQYMKFGFEPVAVVKYIPGQPWSAEMDAWRSAHRAADGTLPDANVYIMKLRDGLTAEDVLRGIANHEFKKYVDEADLSVEAVNQHLPEALKNLPPEEQYDAFIKYRDDLIDAGSSTMDLTAPKINEPSLNGIDGDPEKEIPFFDTVTGTYSNTGTSSPIPLMRAGQERISPDQVVSQSRQTMQREMGLSDAEMDVYFPKKGFLHDVEHIAPKKEEASKRASNDLEGLWQEYHAAKNGQDQPYSDYELHEMTNGYLEFARRAKEAKKAGDPDAYALYMSRANTLATRVSANSTDAGRRLRIAQEYAKTPEGARLAALEYQHGKTQEWMEANRKASNGIDALAQKIADFMRKHHAEAVMMGEDVQAKDELRHQFVKYFDRIYKDANPKAKNALKGITEASLNDLLYYDQLEDISEHLDTFAAFGKNGISNQTMDKVMDLFEQAGNYHVNSKEYMRLESSAYSLIANDLNAGGSWRDKVDAIRYFSMLANPTTHIRNMSGNILMDALSGAKNTLAGVLESATDAVNRAFTGQGIDRTKAFLNAGDRQLIADSERFLKEYKWRDIASGSKFADVGGGIDRAMGAFANQSWMSRAFNKASNLNDAALSEEDTIFKAMKFQTSLAGYLKANGEGPDVFKLYELNYDDIDNVALALFQSGEGKPEMFRKALSEYADHQNEIKKGVGASGADISALVGENSAIREIRDALRKYVDGARKVLDNGSAYAIHQAREATFQQDNLIAEGVSDLSKKWRGHAAGLLLDTAIPFKKTPANILKTIGEYSPVSFLKVLKDIGRTSRGAKLVADQIDDLSKGLVGSGLIALGAWAADKGIIRIGSNEHTSSGGFKTENFDKMYGKIPVSIRIGDHDVGIGDFSPASAPLIIGATLYDSYKESLYGDGASALNAIGQGLAAVSDSVIDMTMLSGLSSIMESVRYAESGTDTMEKLLVKSLTDWSGQMLPTVGRKLETTLDPVARSSRDDHDGFLGKFLSQAKFLGTKIPMSQSAGEWAKKNHVPVLRLLAREPRIDGWGREIENAGGSLGGRAINNFLNPTVVTREQKDELNMELDRLAASMTRLGKDGEDVFPYTSAKKEGRGLSDHEFTNYAQFKGTTSKQLISSLIHSYEYQSLSDQQKYDTIKDLYRLSQKMAENKFQGTEITNKSDQRLCDLFKNGGSEEVVKEMMKDMMRKRVSEKVKELSDGSLSNDAKVDYLNHLQIPEARTVVNEGLLDRKGQAGQFVLADGSWVYQDSKGEVKSYGSHKEEDKGEPALATIADKVKSYQESYGSSGVNYHKYKHALKYQPELDPEAFFQNYQRYNMDGVRSITQTDWKKYYNQSGVSFDDLQQAYAVYGNESKSQPAINKRGQLYFTKRAYNPYVSGERAITLR